LRSATVVEYEELTQLICSMDPWLSLDISSDKMLDRWKADPSRFVLVYYNAEGKSCACISYSYEGNAALLQRKAKPLVVQYFDLEDETSFPASVYINNVAVWPSYQSKGIGKTMLDEVERLTREKPIKYIFLMVNFKNMRAMNFYKREGFQNIGEIKDLLKVGNIEYLMVKRIQ